MSIEPDHSVSYKIACVPSEDRSACTSESLQGTLWVAEDPKHLQADSKEPDQPVRMRRLICVFDGRICKLVGNAVPRLNILLKHLNSGFS